MKLRAAIFAVASLCSVAHAQAPPGLVMKVTGPPVAVFTHASDACEIWDIPDAPARAIRTSDGQVLLFATHFHNYLLRGRDLRDVHPDCHEVYAGAELDNPAAFNDRAWLAAPFTRDGVTIIAVVHNEFQGHRRPALCPSGRYLDCWYNALTLAVSHDSGASFTASGLVAALPYRYDEVTGAHRGYFNPSNIVPFGNDQMMFAFATDARAQHAGNCLLRTERPEDPQSWRGWDGQGFGVRFINPYTQHDVSGVHVCTPVAVGQLRWPITSLVHHIPSGLFIAMMQDAGPGGGVYYATSRDLLSWSEPVRLMSSVGTSAWHCGDTSPLAYPAILDASSSDFSFATIDNTPILFLTRFNAHDCALGADRDLIRLPLAVAPGR
jgi:hypothetical protein